MSGQRSSSSETLVSKLLETDPYVESAYYIGFRIADHELALDPNGHATGMTGPVGYWHVSDSRKSMRSLLDAGTQRQPEIKDIGQGKLIASVKKMRRAT